MNKEDKVMTYATAFCMVSAGVLMLAFVPSAIGIRQTQKARFIFRQKEITAAIQLEDHSYRLL